MYGWLHQEQGEKIWQCLAKLAFLTIFCGANFFATIYVRRCSQESLLRHGKKSEAELDISISVISKSIMVLEKSREALCRARTRALADSLPAVEIAKLDKEINAVVCEIGNMNYLISSLRGGIQPDRLMTAVEIIVRRAAANLSTAAYIDKQALTLAVTRDVDMMRLPVSLSTVKDALEPYRDEGGGTGAWARNLAIV